MLRIRTRIQSGLITLVILSGFLFSHHAHAIEALKFRDEYSTTLKFQIDHFLQQEQRSDASQYVIATVDLNNDGVSEHILKRKSCNTPVSTCTFIIIAEKGDRILLLSKISAKNLMVDGKVTYGVKNLLAFNDDMNDYEYDIYMWSPKEKLYIMDGN
ncbi:MAG: hypothetical protein ACTHOO_10760 [Alcanivorax sp.]